MRQIRNDNMALAFLAKIAFYAAHTYVCARKNTWSRTMKFPLTADITPNFAKGGGLVAAIAQDAGTREVLMLAWMNQEAWERTLETGEAHYYSRSRASLWHKGGTSGHVQKVRGIRLDCDADALVLFVEQIGGAACHEGFRSCFSRELTDEGTTVCCPRVFDPKEVYP